MKGLDILEFIVIWSLMKHYATWVDLFEILNGEFKKEMVGGGGACPSFVDNVQGP